MYIDTSIRLEVSQAPKTINDHAAELVAQYDRDGDGKLSAYEHTVRDEESGDPLGRMRTSIERLAVLADKMGTADGVTEAWEIADVMRLFDTGDTYSSMRLEANLASAHDGALTGSELASFQNTIGPERTGYPRVDWTDPVDPVPDRSSPVVHVTDAVAN